MATDALSTLPTMVSSPPSGVVREPESPWQFLAFLWTRLWLILFIVAVAVGLGYLYYLKQTPVFQSSGKVLIVVNRSNLPIPGITLQSSMDTSRDEVVRSSKVISAAVEKHDLKSLPSLRGLPDPVSSVAANLTVTTTKSSGTSGGDILTITYRCPDADDCQRILTAVISEYQAFTDMAYRTFSQEMIDLITQARDVLDKEISEMEEAYRQFRAKSPLLTVGDSTKNVHQARMQEIEAIRAMTWLENTKLQARIDAIESILQHGVSAETLRLLASHLTPATPDGKSEANLPAGSAVASPQTLDQQLWPLLLEEQLLLEKYGPMHPQVLALRKRIELTQNYLLGTAARGEKKSDDDFYKAYLDALRQQIRLNQETIRKMDEVFEQERQAAQSLAKFEAEENTLRSQLARKQRLFDAVVSRLEEINLVEKATGGQKIEILTAPRRGLQIAPNLKQIITTSVIFGLLAGVGLAYLVEAADRRFRSPEEIRTTLGVPVVGHIPVITPERKRKKDESEDETFARLDKCLVTCLRPSSHLAEAYRAVRTAIYFHTRGKEHQVIQVTSPAPGDGKSTLAANLAITIAQSGKSVLLIDADMRRPRIDKMFGAAAERGLSDVLQGTSELIDCIQHTSIPGLDMLSKGSHVANPSELLASQSFAELLQLLRARYQFLVLDSPPVLAVSDPLNIAPRADSVLVVLRLTKNARRIGRRTVELLESVGAKVHGVVVNGIGGGPEYERYGYRAPYYGYGYGGYGYKYGYYAYGYSIGYGRYGYDYKYGYYSDEKPAPDKAVKAGGPTQNGKS